MCSLKLGSRGVHSFVFKQSSYEPYATEAESFRLRWGLTILGCNVRQYRVGQYHTHTFRGQPGIKTLIKPSDEAIQRHLDEIKAVIPRYRSAPQAALVAALNPIIRGWSLYYRACVAKRAFARIDSQVYRKLYQWAQYRRRRKSPSWRFERYWQRQGTRDTFSDGTSTLARHEDTPIVRHVKSLP